MSFARGVDLPARQDHTTAGPEDAMDLDVRRALRLCKLDRVDDHDGVDRGVRESCCGHVPDPELRWPAALIGVLASQAHRFLRDVDADQVRAGSS
jgi:hypothetical protein